MSIPDRRIAGPVGDRYEITGLIASGGMGTVYRAYDTVLERPVAIKVLHEGDPDVVMRLRTEALNAARLSHPAIVHVYDFGTDETGAYIAMELVEGQTLRDLLSARTVLRPEMAAGVALQVATALEHARRAGIMHRDVKPENILVTRDGQVKVTDFGLSQAFTADRRSGPLYGTAHYLAPEQVEGHDADHRADVYALGVVLYEMLTGRTPFDGSTSAEIARARVTTDVPSPMAFNPGVPRELDRVVVRATARDVDDRFPTAGAMAEALRSAGVRADTGDLGALVHHTALVSVDGEPTVALRRAGERMKRRSKRRALTASVAVLVLVAAAFAAVRLQRVDVPRLVGLTQEEARSALEGRGLDADIVLRNHSTVLAGRVIAQSPEPGATIRTGGAVRLFVSIGPLLVSPPNVVGMPVADAEAILTAKGFFVSRVEGYDPTIPPLHVSEQSIDAGVLVEKGSTITITVSKGPEMVRVPDVVGDPEESARADLARAGFEVSIVREQNDRVAAGTVIAQRPAATTRARKGSTVTLRVSKGPPLVTVPSLRCLTRKQAEDRLAHAGLRGRFEGGGARVVDQSPADGSRAPKGSTVNVFMGYGSFC